MKPWYVCGATIVAVFFIYIWHIDSQARMAKQELQFCTSDMVAYSTVYCKHVRYADCRTRNTLIKGFCNNA